MMTKTIFVVVVVVIFLLFSQNIVVASINSTKNKQINIDFEKNFIEFEN